MTEPVKQRTPSEMLMKALELFGDAEPSQAVLIWTDADEHVHFHCTPRSYVAAIGLLTACLLDFSDTFLKGNSGQE